MKIATYLRISNNCNEAFETYKEIFQGEEICKYIYNEHMTEDKNLIGKIFHAELKIKEFYIYMSDTQNTYDYQNQAYKITVEVDSLDEANRIFDELKDGGTVNSPITKMPFGPSIGNVSDKFGITWDIVSC